MKQYTIAMSRALTQSFLLLFTLAAMSGPKTYAQDRPIVLASIQPLAMIAQAVAGDTAEIITLLPPSVSPHSYSLSFSDRRKMIEADVVLWVGPQLETMLAKPILALSHTAVVEAAAINGITWPEAEHQHTEADHAHGDRRDPHLWLNPRNALLIAGVVKNQLVSQLPGQRAQLNQNLQRFSKEVEAFIENSKRQLSAVRGEGFVVMHDAYQHLIGFYQLNQLGVVRLSNSSEKGLKHRAKLLSDSGSVRCVFSEPQFPSSWASQLAEPLNAKVAELDPMGGKYRQPGVSGQYRYIQFMQSLADNLAECLQP